MRGMESWLRTTRLRAPSTLASDVEEILRREDSPAAGATAPERGILSLPALPAASRRGRRAPARPAWSRVFPAAASLAAASLAIVLLIGPFSGDRAPRSPDRPDVSAVGAVPEEGTSVLTPPSENPAGTVRYTFSVRAPSASEVCLAGDFNQWKVCEAQLIRVGEDVWTIALELPRGRHEYMFVVDGRWVTDPSAALYSDDGFGNRNAVVLL